MLDRLETAFADQKEFLTDVGHELRTPITVIRGHVETLGDTPREREEAIAVIQDELDRMSRFVDDLLLLTKASRPDFLRPEPVDLDLLTHDLFDKARQPRRARLAPRGHRGRDRGRRPAAAHPGGDEPRRRTPSSHTGTGEPIWIGSSLSRRARTALGPRRGPGDEPGRPASGSSSATSARGRPTAAGPSGAGLGLAIVHAIAEAHGGWVELDSAPGAGVDVHDRDPDQPGDVSRILIAEDEARLASFLEKGLRSAGFTTTVTADGNAAAALARDEDFDLLILDLGLPGQDGLDGAARRCDAPGSGCR